MIDGRKNNRENQRTGLCATCRLEVHRFSGETQSKMPSDRNAASTSDRRTFFRWQCVRTSAVQPKIRTKRNFAQVSIAQHHCRYYKRELLNLKRHKCCEY